MSTPPVCPIRLVALSIMSSAVVGVISEHPKHVDRLADMVDKSDKNCNTHKCAMWDKRRKRCGLIQGGVR